jgi:hypothetical protein
VVESRACPQVPYGDTFSGHVRYCITWTGNNSCKVLISSGIKWYKNPMVKCKIYLFFTYQRLYIKECDAAILRSETMKATTKGIEEKFDLIQSMIGPKNTNNPKDIIKPISSSGSTELKSVPQSRNPSRVQFRAEESILPFGLSQSVIGQWGLVALLVLSLFVNLFYRTSHTQPIYQQSSFESFVSRNWTSADLTTGRTILKSQEVR